MLNYQRVSHYKWFFLGGMVIRSPMTIRYAVTGYVIGLSLLADGVPLIGVMGDLAIPLSD